MKEGNLFEGAKRGDKFRTRNGEMAIFLRHLDDWGSSFLYEDDSIGCVFNSTGCHHDLECFVTPEDYLLDRDIVSRWQEN